jgi:hypothetical protein
MNDDPVIAIFKLGAKTHMTELLQDGHVYMNTVSFFAGLEDGTPRADRAEGTAYSEPAEGATLKRQGEGNEEWLTLGTLASELRYSDPTLATTNLYSLHVRRQSQYGALLDLDRLGFGDSYVLFLDGREFLRRLNEATTRVGHRVATKLVGYVDRRVYRGQVGVFRKFSEHASKSELRIAVLPGTGKPLSLRLGNLSDIAIMGSTNERLRLDPKGQPSRANREEKS